MIAIHFTSICMASNGGSSLSTTSAFIFMMRLPEATGGLNLQAEHEITTANRSSPAIRTSFLLTRYFHCLEKVATAFLGYVLP
jgi:hypothetical protein